MDDADGQRQVPCFARHSLGCRTELDGLSPYRHLKPRNPSAV